MKRVLLALAVICLTALTPAQKKLLLQGSNWQTLVRSHGPTFWGDSSTTNVQLRPLVHYLLEDNAASTAVVDKSGNYAGVASANTSTFCNTAAKISKGCTFAVASSHLIDTGADTIGTGADSACMWINPTLIATAQVQMLLYNASLVFYLSNVDGKFRFTSNNSTVLTSNRAVTAGAFWHICITRDAAGAGKFYINGAVDANAGSTGAPAGGAINVFVGNRNDGARTFGGILDDIRIYDRALTAAEVTQIYNSGAGHQFSATTNSGQAVVVDALNNVLAYQGEGKEFYQSTVANRPAYVTGVNGINGRAAMRFDGAASNMVSTSTLANLYAAGAKTAFIVMRPGVINVYQYVFGTASGSWFAQVANASARMTMTNDDSAPDTAYVGGMAVGSTGVFTFTHDGTNLRLANNSAWGPINASGNTAVLTSTMVLGSFGASQYTNGSIAELITFNKVLPQSDIVKIQRGLCRKWGANC